MRLVLAFGVRAIGEPARCEACGFTASAAADPEVVEAQWNAVTIAVDQQGMLTVSA